MRTFQAKRVADLSDDRGVARRMADAVELCRDKSYWVPAVILVASGIDRLCGIHKSRKAQRSAYLKLLKTGFPDLCKHISPAEFYSKYRSGLVHEFSPKKGFALANDQEMSSEYVADFAMRGTHKHLRGLNVDRLIKDFLVLARSRSSWPAYKPTLLRAHGEKEYDRPLGVLRSRI